MAGIGFLVVLLSTVLASGASAFTQAFVALELDYDPEVLGIGAGDDLAAGNVDRLVVEALASELGIRADRATRRELRRLLSIDAAFVARSELELNPDLLGKRHTVLVPAAANVDMYLKGRVSRAEDPAQRPLTDRQLDWIDRLVSRERLGRRFNTALFSNGDSREPELAGIRGAVKGSLLMLVVTVGLAFPIGVAAAIYLEEFAPRNRLSDFIEVSINNLAAVPSIVFGLLGLAVFINWFGLPRSSPLVGGLVLSILTLPVIVISARNAIRAVPASIREAALGIGASRMQVVVDHVLPLAVPGILTGTIIGMSRALGETAPLLMIGMVAFIVDVPTGLGDPATGLPVQIFLWADSPERAFAERTSAAILVLLAFLLAMNLVAVIIRRRLER